MINDLLDLARSDAGKLRIDPEPTPVRAPGPARRAPHAAQLRGARASGSRSASRRTCPTSMADPDRIGQVLSNLLTNANKYAQEGAKVRLTAAQVGNAGRVRGLRRRARPGRRGARPRLRALLAGPERRDPGGRRHRPGPRDREIPGRAARRRDLGRARRPGKGATFRFVLPIAKDGRPARKSSGNGRGTAAKARAVTRLLVADDSETVLLMLQRRLEASGYEVETATDGVEVLDAIEKADGKSAPDLILLDAMMPPHVGHRRPAAAARGRAARSPS